MQQLINRIDLIVASAFCLGLSFAPQLQAEDILYRPEPDSPIGERNADSPPGTGQYGFLIGDWEVDVTLNRPGQDALRYTARWHNHWIANGYIVMQEWRGPYTTGIELRSYDASQDLWHGRNLYVPTPGTWYENTARLSGEEMVVTTRRSDPAAGESITREIYFDIGDTAFRIRTELSTDGGNTWTEGRYSATCRRITTGKPATR